MTTLMLHDVTEIKIGEIHTLEGGAIVRKIIIVTKKDNLDIDLFLADTEPVTGLEIRI